MFLFHPIHFLKCLVNVLMKKVVTEKKSVLTIGFPQQVNHSQGARDTPLRVWVLTEKCGTVIAAHCDCMAGLC